MSSVVVVYDDWAAPAMALHVPSPDLLHLQATFVMWPSGSVRVALIASPTPGSSDERVSVPASFTFTTCTVTLVDAMTVSSYVDLFSKSGLVSAAMLISPLD